MTLAVIDRLTNDLGNGKKRERKEGRAWRVADQRRRLLFNSLPPSFFPSRSSMPSPASSTSASSFFIRIVVAQWVGDARGGAALYLAVAATHTTGVFCLDNLRFAGLRGEQTIEDWQATAIAGHGPSATKIECCSAYY